jgi:hypothetical protein
MIRLLPILVAILLTTLVARALPAVQDPTVGNVTTTGFSACWSTSEAASPGLRVYTDAAGTQDITDEVLVEFQSLAANRREVRSTPATRDASRQVQAQMESRNVFLARIGSLTPDTNYWVRVQALDGGSNLQDESALLPLTTAARAAFLVESRQLLVDLSGAGDLAGAIIRISNPDSPYPLFAVVNDGQAGSQAWFDLNNFLDATGESHLVTTSGMTLDLTVAIVGAPSATGTFSGTEIAYDGTPLAASTSTALFSTTSGLNLSITSTTPPALLGQPLSLRLEATSGSGSPLPDFDRPVDLTSPALPGGGLSTTAFTDGILAEQVVTLTTPGPQTITATDPVSGATSTINLEVLTYSYPNFRRHFYGDETNPAGEQAKNNDSDPFSNILEFLFGLNPLVLDGNLELDAGGILLRRGGPVTTLRIDAVQGVDFRVTFLRHRDHAALGLDYTPQLSSDGKEWFDSTQAPVVIGQYGDMELVYVPYPYFTPRARKATLFRVALTIQ